jgi:microcystin-dependent protein
MKKRNWADLARKLVDRFDMNDTLQYIQDALGKESKASWGPGVLDTQTYPNPFQFTMSGVSLGGTVSAGIAYDPNGQIVEVPSTQNFTLVSNPSNPVYALLVLRFKFTPDTLIPKPSDPILNVFLNLHDDFELQVLTGTPAPSPTYPVAGSNDVVLMGFQIPAAATLGTQVTLDSSQKQVGFRPATRVSIDTTSLKAVKELNVQKQTEVVDLMLQHGAMGIGSTGEVHDQATITCNSGGTAGHKVTLAGVDFIVGTGVNQIPPQVNAQDLAFALMRMIRGWSAFSGVYAASASRGVVTVYALATGAVGGSLSATGASFSVSAASLSGNGIRKRVTALGIQAQLDQIDDLIFKIAPPGEIIEFGGTTLPDRTFVCDGTAKSRTVFADLFAAIGTKWGAGDGSTTFNIPHLSGRFTRGVNSGAGVDPDAGSRIALFSGGATGDNVGSYQNTATKRPNTNFTTDTQGDHGHSLTSDGSHTHTIDGVGDHTHFYVAPFGDQAAEGGGGAICADEPEYGNNTAGAGSHSHSMQAAGGHSHTVGNNGNHTHTITGGGDSESRPPNAYVLKCIRY